ncbi:two component transcriptional regulator, winged helix family [gut metagenome]|uniref:Two component transcriptional regulator, winged helix family n=1 Tax=gut metagenome TaxID=749906 RepID=J9G981_9ZZZZ
MRSVLRRTGKKGEITEIGELRIDLAKGVVTRRGEEIFLSALEYRLLLVFLNHRGRILTRAQLLEEIWDIAGEYVNDNTLTVYIKRLRDKIEKDPQKPELIKTVAGDWGIRWRHDHGTISEQKCKDPALSKPGGAAP